MLLPSRANRARPSIESIDHIRQALIECRGLRIPKYLQQPVRTEFFARRILSFGDPVGVEVEPIAHHQALAFLIVDMYVAVERVGLLIEDAARAIDAADDRAVGAAAAAFVDAVEASRFVGSNGVQILGGHGFMRDFPVEKAMRDARALGLLAGGCDAAREDAGAALAAIPLRAVA